MKKRALEPDDVEEEFENKNLLGMLKRTIKKGVNNSWMNEDMLRSVLGEIPGAKEVLPMLMQQARTLTKNLHEESLLILKEELSKISAKIDPQEMLKRTLENYSLEFKANLQFVPKKGSAPEKPGRKTKGTRIKPSEA